MGEGRPAAFIRPAGWIRPASRSQPVIASKPLPPGFWTTPRLLRIEPDGRKTILAEGGRNGPWTGVTFHRGTFFVAEGGQLEGGRILQISADGQIRTLISGLPSRGDHHTNGPVVGPDGGIYFGQGTATNSAIVGGDNHEFGWLRRFPEFHDIPGRDVVLTGFNATTKDYVRGRGRAVTGAFVPFGTATRPGQIIPAWRSRPAVSSL